MREVKKAIERLASNSIIPFDEGAAEVCNLAIEALKKQMNNGWILVSERLPEKGLEILVCNENRGIFIAKYMNYWGNMKYMSFDNITETYHSYTEIVAWQPLPEPYKEASKDAE